MKVITESEAELTINEQWLKEKLYDINKYNISKIIDWFETDKKIYILAEPFPSMATKDLIVWSWSFKHNSDGCTIDHTWWDESSYCSKLEALKAAIEFMIDHHLI